MARQALFHQLKNGKWKFKCKKCGSDGQNDWFEDKREAEIAFDMHWIYCGQVKNK